MTIATLLRLGRVSNLPTVWSNVLAGVALAEVTASPETLAAVSAAISLLYVSGMALNDYFDRATDARDRPERPIPKGETTPHGVLILGATLMAAGLLLLALVAFHTGHGVWGVVAGLGLSAAILVYDAWHKHNPLSPLVMGLCRMLVYVATAVALSGKAPPGLWLAGALLFAYVVGLTYAAAGEHWGRRPHAGALLLLAAPLAYAGFGLVAARDAVHSATWLLSAAIWLALAVWVGGAVITLRRGGPSVPRGIVALIAGISLWDAWLAAERDRPLLAAVCVGCFVLTRIWQRLVPGT